MSTPGKCDICLFKDGHYNLNLLKCKECGVCVHDQCYGWPEGKDPDFVCWACDAVGNDELGITTKNELKYIKQKSRPTECALCSIKDGLHAMHPLYDVPGKDGKPLIVPIFERDRKTDKEQRAWVHTLCGCVLSSKGGLAYGTDKYGNYELDEDAEKIESQHSMKHKNDSSVTNDDEDDDDNNLTATHHFIISDDLDENGKDTDWSWAIKQQRKTIKCIICGKADTYKGCTRIPIQCTAGDEDEHEHHKESHKELPHPCTQGFHVGCAMWGRPIRNRRVFFFPGVHESRANGEEYVNETIIDCYCYTHADDVARFKKDEKKKSSAQSRVIMPPKPQPPVKYDTRKNPAYERRMAKRMEKAKANATTQTRQLQNHIIGAADSSGHQRKKPIVGTGVEDAAVPLKHQDHSALGQSIINQKRKRMKNFDGSNNNNNSNKKRKSNYNNLIEEISNYVKEEIRKAEKRGDPVPSATKDCRKFWKNKTSEELNESDFKDVWKKVKEVVMEWHGQYTADMGNKNNNNDRNENTVDNNTKEVEEGKAIDAATASATASVTPSPQAVDVVESNKKSTKDDNESPAHDETQSTTIAITATASSGSNATINPQEDKDKSSTSHQEQSVESKERIEEEKKELMNCEKEEHGSIEQQQGRVNIDTLPVSPPSSSVGSEIVKKEESNGNGESQDRWKHLHVNDPNYSGDYEMGDWDSHRVVKDISKQNIKHEME